jgi:hypothetical protein
MSREGLRLASLRAAPPLSRRGSQLFGENTRWDMVGVYGPFSVVGGEEEYFRIETANAEVLWVYKPKEERGMRIVFLVGKGEWPALSS